MGLWDLIKSKIMPDKTEAPTPPTIPERRVDGIILSQYSNMPRYFVIGGVKYDLDNPEDIDKLPLIDKIIQFQGKDYGIDSVLLEHGLQAYYKCPAIYDAANRKVDEYRENGIKFVSDTERSRKETAISALRQQHIKEAGNKRDDSLTPVTRNIAYFKDGALVNVHPRDFTVSLYDDRGTAYNAKVIVSDGRKYDLMDAKSVSSIPCPKFGSAGGSTTSSLDYILRMCASNIRNAGYNEQSIVVLRKANQLMPYSGIGWSEKDYLRLVEWLYRDGRIEDGDKARKFILTDETIQSKANVQRIAIQNFQRNSKNGLVMYNSYSSHCCEICAKYSGRVYRTSWTPETRKYPELPKFLADCGCWHIGCGSSTSPFEPNWGMPVYYLGKRLPLEEVQDRPYVDERTEDDKRKYEQTIARIRKEDKIDYLDRLREYHLLKARLPEGMMPKSLSAYTKIKNANTERYQAIIAEAKAFGIL